MSKPVTHPISPRLTAEERRNLDRAYQTLATRGDALPRDEAWMTGGAGLAFDLIPPCDWGEMDPAKAGDAILLVAGRGAFVVP